MSLATESRIYAVVSDVIESGTEVTSRGAVSPPRVPIMALCGAVGIDRQRLGGGGERAIFFNFIKVCH